MSPACPKCASDSTRRRIREKTLKHRFMHLFSLYPWECLTCQNVFFHSKRYSRSKRHAMGEVYTGSETAPKVSPVGKEGFQR